MATYYGVNEDSYLSHHGIKGMKWGIRKDRNKKHLFGRKRTAFSGIDFASIDFYTQKIQSARRKVDAQQLDEWRKKNHDYGGFYKFIVGKESEKYCKDLAGKTYGRLLELERMASSGYENVSSNEKRKIQWANDYCQYYEPNKKVKKIMDDLYNGGRPYGIDATKFITERALNTGTKDPEKLRKRAAYGAPSVVIGENQSVKKGLFAAQLMDCGYSEQKAASISNDRWVENMKYFHLRCD